MVQKKMKLSNHDLLYIAGAVFGPVHSIVLRIISRTPSKFCFTSFIQSQTTLSHTEIKFALVDLLRGKFIVNNCDCPTLWGVNTDFSLTKIAPKKHLHSLQQYIKSTRSGKGVGGKQRRVNVFNVLKARRKTLANV